MRIHLTQPDNSIKMSKEARFNHLKRIAKAELSVGRSLFLGYAGMMIDARSELINVEDGKIYIGGHRYVQTEGYIRMDWSGVEFLALTFEEFKSGKARKIEAWAHNGEFFSSYREYLASLMGWGKCYEIEKALLERNVNKALELVDNDKNIPHLIVKGGKSIPFSILHGATIKEAFSEHGAEYVIELIAMFSMIAHNKTITKVY